MKRYGRARAIGIWAAWPAALALLLNALLTSTLLAAVPPLDPFGQALICHAGALEQPGARRFQRRHQAQRGALQTLRAGDRRRAAAAATRRRVPSRCGRRAPRSALGNPAENLAAHRDLRVARAAATELTGAAAPFAFRRWLLRTFPCIPCSTGARGFSLASSLVVLCSVPVAAQAQTPPAPDRLPTIVVQQSRAKPPARRRAPRVEPATAPAPATADAASLRARHPSGVPSQALLTAQQALAQINRTPGGVAIVPAAAYRNSTVANTIKDVLDYVPGVFAQPKWGDDTRLSIRGSGLSRNFHLRGVQLYMDGIPINTADGYGDFQEIDPTAYKYVEVFKGGNALRFGANSLGGAINFVTPSGRDPWPNGVSLDVGAFGYRRLQANAGGVNGAWTAIVTASTQAADGFRDHSDGHATRVSGNVGYQFSPDMRDAVLSQRQRGAAAHSRHRDQDGRR